MSDKNYLPDYRDKLGSRRFTGLSDIQPGDFVQFNYKGQMRMGMLLAANYKDKLHVISLKELPVSGYTEMVKRIHPVPRSPQELYERVRNISLDFEAYRQYLLRDVNQLQKILPKKEKNK
jgi:hypothetical protein